MNLNLIEKGKIDAHVDAGWGTWINAREYDWKKSSLHDLVMEYKKTGKFKTKTYQRGLKRNSSHTTDITILRSVIGSPTKLRERNIDISQALKKAGIDISARTVLRFLVEHGLNRRKDAKTTLLRKNYIKGQLYWALSHAQWTHAEWKRVMWME